MTWRKRTARAMPDPMVDRELREIAHALVEPTAPGVEPLTIPLALDRAREVGRMEIIAEVRDWAAGEFAEARTKRSPLASGVALRLLGLLDGLSADKEDKTDG